MEYSDLKQYFNDYIKKYTPYQNNKIYEIIIEYLTDHYFKDMYDVTPEDFKTLYEQNVSIESVYNQLLMAVGVHNEVIKKLRVNEKKTFLMALSDFQRYKGSVDLFKKIATVYKDKFNIYELYVDRDNKNDWILRPYKIYTGITNLKLELKPIPYNVAYNTIPSLLVSEDQLSYYYENNLGAFPMKTNIISLQYMIETYVSELLNLSIATFLKVYKKEAITIYHRDTTFTLGLKDISYIWYYLFHKYYNTFMSEFSLQQILLLSDDINPYSLEDIEDIRAEYDKLDFSSDMYDFYNKYFNKVFKTIHKNDQINLSEIEYGVFRINKNYLLYIKERLEDPAFDDDKILRKKEFATFMDEIYDSLLLYQDTKLRDPEAELFNKYFEIFLSSLNHLVINPKDTVSYLLMYNFKPYHTEILTDYLDSLVIDDKFNMINAKDEFTFLIKLIRADYLDTMLDFLDSVDIKYHTKDLSYLVDIHKFCIKYNFTPEEINVEDFYKNVVINKKAADALAITLKYIHDIKLYKNSFNVITDKEDFDIKKVLELLYDNEINEEIINFIIKKNIDISAILPKYNHFIKLLGKSFNVITDKEEFNTSNVLKQLYKLDEKNSSNVIENKIDILAILSKKKSDKFNLKLLEDDLKLSSLNEEDIEHFEHNNKDDNLDILEDYDITLT